ncbi:hypothetical protein RIF29_37196 [Crotalaria pallida]|uniref:HhH-GPD domain-containing protein n=1 Tax=Crotalaria pallida TaxID=3830 RepID=A0AAN9EC38_CROPI
MKRTRSDDTNPGDSQSLLPSSKIPFRARKIPKLTSNILKSKPEEPHNPKIPSTPSPIIPKPLTYKDEINLAIHHLRSADPLLANCIDSFAPPELVTNRAPFFSLVRNIISQQLSNKAAHAIEARFLTLFESPGSVKPETLLALTVQQLRSVGISGPKANYLHDLASKYRDGVLSDCEIVGMDDETLFEKLTMVKGIGPWSVHMFMIFTLHRPDVLPVGDLVVRRGVERLYGLKGLPKPSEMEKLCEKWRPYRSVGAWYMYRLVEAKGVLQTL